MIFSSMMFGALEPTMKHCKVKEIPNAIMQNDDVTIVTTLNTCGEIITRLEQFEGKYVNYCIDLQEVTPVIITKMNFKGKDYLFVENLFFEDGQVKNIEHENTILYVDYNLRFITPSAVFENLIANNALVFS